ncbi:MAG: hypothetical protein WBO10_12665 [Pyrinomonadaceae bacterium]
MKIKACVLSIVTLLFVGSGVAQTATSTPLSSDEVIKQMLARQRLEQIRREDTEIRLAQMRSRVSTGNIEDVWLEKGPLGISVRYNKFLSAEDSQAIFILPVDITAYEDFLREPKTGIVRLQRSDVCPQKTIVLRGADNCPNAIRGKATAFSFRTGRYRDTNLADIVFNGDKIAKSGTLTIGILSDLGDTDIDSLSMTSEGVRQLSDFTPASVESEIDRQYAVLQRGAVIGNHVYGPDVAPVVGNTYVMRSVAYRGKIGNEGKGFNPLLDDERVDVTVAFKVIRKLSDGSIVMVWKELARRDSPDIIIDTKKVK